MSESGKSCHSRITLRSTPTKIPQNTLKKIKDLTQQPILKSYLKLAIAYLRHESRCKHNKTTEKAKRYCWTGSTNRSTKDEVILPSYQMLFFVKTIRNAILSHDWDTALDLLLILLQKGKKYFTKYFVKSCLPIVFHHPNSTPDFLYTFFETVTGYVEDKDLEKFILLLFRIRENIRPGVVQHRRKHIKAISDPRFSLDSVEVSLDEGCEDDPNHDSEVST